MFFLVLERYVSYIKLLQCFAYFRRTYFNFSCQSRCFCASLDMLGENRFQSKLCLKTSIFLFANYISGKKVGLSLWRHFRNFGGVEQKPSVTNL